MNGLHKEFIEINRLIVNIAPAEILSDIFTVASQKSIPGIVVKLRTKTIRMKVMVAYLFA
jgi:hypothetical protein